MKSIKNIFLTVVISLFCATAFAHPGHDHSHWSSGWAHLALIAIPAVAVVLGFIAYKKHKSTKA